MFRGLYRIYVFPIVAVGDGKDFNALMFNIAALNHPVMAPQDVRFDGGWRMEDRGLRINAGNKQTIIYNAQIFNKYS